MGCHTLVKRLDHSRRGDDCAAALRLLLRLGNTCGNGSRRPGERRRHLCVSYSRHRGHYRRSRYRPQAFTYTHAVSAVVRDDLNRIWVLRKVLNPLSQVEAMELLLDKLGKTKSNAEFLAAMQKMG